MTDPIHEVAEQLLLLTSAPEAANEATGETVPMVKAIERILRDTLGPMVRDHEAMEAMRRRDVTIVQLNGIGFYFWRAWGRKQQRNVKADDPASAILAATKGT